MQLIGRELTDEIDILIQARIERREADRICVEETTQALDERIEICKRNITDSLLAMDVRKGVYVDDSAEA